MKWLDVNILLKIHEKVINTTGGSYGVRDKNLLESALYAPLASFGGEDLYIGVLRKAAVLLNKITNNHPFMDGNKRTGFVAAVTVLELNGYKFSGEQKEVVNFMMEVAQGKKDDIQIEQWLKKHSI